ncbi:MAG: hypothetical protein COA40_09195 [Aequorivita sp.]|nr:MAG: hypothetical protein COA40_09195 [Aequorivita sp.]
MVMPFLLVFGTYHLYAKFFDIITPEELAAREQREGEDMALRREKRTLALKGTAANRSVLDTMPGVGVEIQDSFVMQGQELKATVGKGLGTVGAAVASAATNVQAALTSGSSEGAPPAPAATTATANDATNAAPSEAKRE